VVLSVAAWQLGAHDAKPVLQGVQAASAAARATLPKAATAAVSAPAPASAAAGGSAAVLRQLAAIWGLALPDGEPCPTAARLNLRCLQVKGGVAELRLLDRPAMLTLHDDPTAPNYVLLMAMAEHSATIAAPGGKPQSISLDALEARFDGEFTTFWRAPRSWRDEVHGGDHGPDVDWLARRLAQIYGLKKPQEDQPLSSGLRARLTEFQTEQHLKADGVAGPKTFIRLYQLGGVQEPRLLASADAGAGSGAGK